MNKLVETIARRLIERGIRKIPENMVGEDAKFWADGKVLQGQVEVEVYAILKAIDSAEDGWKLVPNEPTAEMLTEGIKELHFDSHPKKIYSTMLAAAPDPLGDDDEPSG